MKNIKTIYSFVLLAPPVWFRHNFINEIVGMCKIDNKFFLYKQNKDKIITLIKKKEKNDETKKEWEME